MLTSSLVSLPPETVRQIVESQSFHERGGGSANERRLALWALAAALGSGVLAALWMH